MQTYGFNVLAMQVKLDYNDQEVFFVCVFFDLLPRNVKVATSASLIYFSPCTLFAVVSTLSCFHKTKIENNSVLAEIPHLQAFSQLDIYLLQASKEH